MACWASADREDGHRRLPRTERGDRDERNGVGSPSAPAKPALARLPFAEVVLGVNVDPSTIFDSRSGTPLTPEALPLELIPRSTFHNFIVPAETKLGKHM